MVPISVTLEKLMNKHTSKPYSSNIVYVFHLAGFTGSRGRSIEKIRIALSAEPYRCLNRCKSRRCHDQVYGVRRPFCSDAGTVIKIISDIIILLLFLGFEILLIKKEVV